MFGQEDCGAGCASDSAERGQVLSIFVSVHVDKIIRIILPILVSMSRYIHELAN